MSKAKKEIIKKIFDGLAFTMECLEEISKDDQSEYLKARHEGYRAGLNRAFEILQRIEREDRK
jgi:hypothetical protein